VAPEAALAGFSSFHNRDGFPRPAKNEARQNRIAEQLSDALPRQHQGQEDLVVSGQQQSKGVIVARSRITGRFSGVITTRLRGLGPDELYSRGGFRRQIAQRKIAPAYFRNDPDAALAAVEELARA